jgi:hypothetical protein
MLAKPLQKAANGFGKYCPEKNELIVRKSRKTLRFIFEKGKVRVLFPTRREVVFYFAPDIRAHELRNFIAEMNASMGY